MREIKFRAWDELNKVMHYDFQFIKSGNEGNDWIIFTSDKQTLGWDELRTENKPHPFNNPYFQQQLKIMQSTSLHDKNGKEIYEGDVVRYITRSYGGFSDVDVTVTGKVYFDYGSFEIKVIYKEPPRLVNNLSKLNYKYSIEVIGNIHENPEFLETE